MVYTPLLPPRQHQQEALRRVRGKSAFALLMDMGTGKTKVVLDEFGQRASDQRDLVKDLFVLAPAGCYRNWFEDRGPDEPSEMRKHLAPEFYKELFWAPYSAGMGVSAKKRMESMLRYTDGPRALFMNIEALSTGKRAREIAERFVSQGRCLMVIDESTKIKSRKAERTQAVLDLGKMAIARRIMTGLVTPRSPLDLFSQFEFLDWRILGHRSFWSFRARYAVMRNLEIGGWTPRTVRVVVGYQNLDELQKKIGPHSYRVLSEECLDLPKQQWITRDVDLTEEQLRLYYEMREFATAALSEQDHVTATMVLTQRLRLDQILCGIVVDENDKQHEIKENRTAALMDLLDEIEGKVVIWTTWDACVRRISAALLKRYATDEAGNIDEDVVARFWGGNAGSRHKDEAKFKTLDKCRFMVSTPSAGGMGNTWTAAAVNVYFNNSDNLEHRLQSERRIYRDGQQRPVLHVDLRAPGTIDDRKIRNLRNKIDIAALIAGEDPGEWLI